MSPSPADGQTPPRKGGRPRSAATPDAIRGAATRLFSEQGFSRTSVRDIAALAGVDAALVIRHFNSKEALFLETVSVDGSFSGIVDGPLETLGRAILARLIEDVPADTGKLYGALFGALDRPEVRAYLNTSTTRHLTEPLTARLRGPHAAMRADLIASQIAGLLVSVWTLESHRRALDSATLDMYARAIQALIDADPEP